MFEDAGAGGGHPAVLAGAQLRDVAASVLGCSGLSLPRAQVEAAVVSFHAGQQALEAARLHLVRLLVATEDRPLHPGAQTRTFLAERVGIGAGSARADLRAAAATDPGGGVLTGMGAALAEGEVTRAHVDVAVRTVAALPTGMVAERGGDVDVLLTAHARAFSPSDAQVLGRYLVETIDPGGVEQFADEAFERRGWTTRTDRSGMVRAEGVLDPVGGAEYLAVLGHLAAPGRTLTQCEDGGTGDGGDPGDQRVLPVVDTRTPAQRGADAQLLMARLAAQALRLEAPAAEPPRVVVHTTLEQLSAHRRARTGEHAGGGTERPQALHPGPATCEQTGPISAFALHRHVCDAHLERVVLDRAGAIVRMESLGRLANRALRRALGARDGGCTWPGCSAPPSWCDAHHVIWWSRGGPTVIENLVLLCPRHHTEAHREHWVITMRQGVPWYTPPRWVDPAQVPRRNTFHTTSGATRAAGARLVAGQQLTLDDPHPP